MKLRTKVTLFFGTLIVFFALLVVGYLHYSVKPSFRQEIEGNLHIVKERNEALYLTFIKGLQMHTLDWSSDEHIKGFTETIVSTTESLNRRRTASDALGAYLRNNKMRYDPTVLMTDLLDQNGIVVASSRPERVGTNESKEEREHQSHYFSKAITAKLGEAFVRSVVFEEDEGPDPMFHVTTRMFSSRLDAHGDPIPLQAVLLVHYVSLEEVSRFFEGGSEALAAVGGTENHPLIQGLDTLETYIVNKDRLLTTPTHMISDVSVKQEINTKPIQECFQDNKENIEEYTNYHGVPVIGMSACLKEDGVVIVNEVDRSEAYGVYNDLVQKTIVIGIAITLSLTLIVFLVGRRILSAIGDIVKVAEWASFGNFNERVTVTSKDEIGYLGSVFNLMLETIQISRNKLKESDEKLKEDADRLASELEERKKQAEFMEQSKRAIQNILEDTEEIKDVLEAEGVRLNAILSSMADALILIDGQYRVVLANPRASEYVNISLTDLIGKDLRQIITLKKRKNGDLPPEMWPTEEMFLTKSVVSVGLEDELSMMTEARPVPLPITLSVSPLGGDISGGVIVMHDITEDRALDDAKSGFISVASHQLRTPLTTIRWYSEMLLSGDAGEVSDSQRDFLKEIHGGAERLYQTIDLLLGISRVESGKIKNEPVPINLALFSEEIARELSPLVQEKKLWLKIVPSEGGQIIVSLDMLTLRQVLLNLYSNAIRYTNDGGTIEASWSGDEEKVTYRVHDNGIGIPEAQRERIFSKFFRAENALAKVPDGSGLGLALVKELVEAWGGQVWFESAEGQGTTFFFTIPKKK